MGNCLKNLKLKEKKSNLEKIKIYKSYTMVVKHQEEKKNLHVDQVFEEIKDVKDIQIKKNILLSESTGKPKEFYDNIMNIARINCGSIKKVKNRITGRIRAEKLIKKELIEVKEEETLIFKELALLRSLDHINIIKVYEFYKDEKYFYLISDYCEHGELFKIIKKEPNGFQELTVAHIMKQLLSVVNYCHTVHNIAHRDLRPEHILVDSIEYNYIMNKRVPLLYIKVSDFKSARTFKHSKKLYKKVGNPYFIAPEVLKRKYNEKCDLWSCGIIMYILLTSKPPFSGTTDTEILAKVKSGNFEHFDSDLENNSIECKALLKELLRSDPDKRPSAAQALNHQWFTLNKIEHEFEHQFVRECFDNLLKFSTELKFQHTVLAYMIFHLVDELEIKEIRLMYETFDTDNDGRLSCDDVAKGFRKLLGSIPYEKEFLKKIRKLDQSKVGYIDYQVFIGAVINKHKILSENNIKLVFSLFVKSEDKESISTQELKSILRLSTKYPDKVWNEIFTELEYDNNNEISLEKFIHMMKKLVN